MSLEHIGLVLIAATTLAIGSWVFWTKPRHPINQSFFVFTLGVSTWTLALVALYVTHDFVFDAFAWIGYLLMIAGIVAFARLFPSGTTLSPQFSFIYIPLGLCAAIIPFNGFISSITIDEQGFVDPQLGPLFPVFVVTTLIYLCLITYLFTINFRQSRGRTRAQMLYLISGIACFIGAFVLFDVLLPIVDIYQLNLLGPASSLIFTILVAVAIVRHQLLDIRVVIQRSLVYSILLGCVVGIYIVLLQFMHYALGPYDETATFISTISTTIIGIFSAPYIERFFRRVTDRIFFKDTYSYPDAVHTLSEVLHRNITLTDLVRESELALAQICKAEGVRIVLDGAADTDADLTIPLMLDGAPIGSIALQQKLSGDPYTAQDMQLLTTFAYQAATALSRAQLYAAAQNQTVILEQRVAERTRELSESRAREQQTLNDLSHNLQTPLTVLQTRLETFKRMMPHNRDITSFEQALAGFSEFVYDLLALARLEGGRAPAHEPLSLSALIADITEEIEVIAAADDITVRAVIAPRLTVHGDERRLREAFLNVASNALKYVRPDGPRQVTIQADRDAAGVRVRITDTGIGIAAAELPRVFDRFYRSAAIPAELKGTGLGLSITKRIVEHHHGTIHIESTIGTGTTVTIHLPTRPTRT